MTAAWPDDRKLASLRAKLSSLDTEFAHWRAESEAGKPLAKHNSQIRRVTAPLDVLRLRIEKRLDDLVSSPGGADDRVADIEMMILDVHRIWEFFRSKLSQRYVDWFRTFLSAADEFVWACYTPVRGAVDPKHVAPENVREPPMVFLNGGWSPFEMSRGLSYEPEIVDEEEFPRQRYRAILDDLPFPVIGVPWYQVRHLPDAVLLGHEVGHTVEDDFRLTKRLDSLLATALKKGAVDAERAGAWSAWLGEIFADVYGTLATGPAFAGALMDLIGGPPKRIGSERADARAWGDYPPAALRMHVTLTALAESGYATESAALRERWLSMFPVSAMTRFEPDAEFIARALIRTPLAELGHKALIEVISFADVEKSARESADRALTGYDPQTTDARALLAAARFAFEQSPAEYLKGDVESRVLFMIESTDDRVALGGGGAVRGGPPPGAAGGAVDLTDHDVALGDRLFDQLSTLRS
jgi:hypothetical protein